MHELVWPDADGVIRILTLPYFAAVYCKKMAHTSEEVAMQSTSTISKMMTPKSLNLYRKNPLARHFVEAQYESSQTNA
jgi:hypothetical protein